MSIEFYGEPFAIVCDKCSAAGPAKRDENKACDAVRDLGWVFDDDPDAIYHDLCPSCAETQRKTEESGGGTAAHILADTIERATLKGPTNGSR